jgi:hypothetical protein
LQGTADAHVLRQATRASANKLAQAGTRVSGTVKFVLDYGGHHGLQAAPNPAESNAQICARFA